jgi:ankyrin repeat protein
MLKKLGIVLTLILALSLSAFAGELHKAAKEGNLKLVKELVSKGADVNAKDKYGRTPLHYAAKEGHLDVVKFLVSKGADVNAKDEKGNTPLDAATPEVAEYLRSLNKNK